MDIKAQITQFTEKITSDKTLLDMFKKDPVKAVEKVAGVDLPNDVVEKIILAVKAKIGSDKLSGAVDMLKKFGSK